MEDNSTTKSFRKGSWRKLTKEESLLYKPQINAMRLELKGWYFGKLYKFYERNEAEERDRLILASRDKSGNYGVALGFELPFPNSDEEVNKTAINKDELA